MAMDHDYVNIDKDKSTKLPRGYTPLTNQSSVGNPITFQGCETKEDPNCHPKKKGEFTRDIFAVSGNFRPNDRAMSGKAGWPCSNKNEKAAVNNMNLNMNNTQKRQANLHSSIFQNETVFNNQNAAKIYRKDDNTVETMAKKVMNPKGSASKINR